MKPSRIGLSGLYCRNENHSVNASGTTIQTSSRITDGAIIMRASERVCCVAIIPSPVSLNRCVVSPTFIEAGGAPALHQPAPVRASDDKALPALDGMG